MARKRRHKRKQLTDLSIEKMAAEGKAMARHEGKVIFVENAVPGDVVDVIVTKNKTDYAVAKVKNIVSPSEIRIKPFCSHFESCGGCKWQYITYEQQAIYKQEIVAEAFSRIGKLDFPELMPIIKGEPTEYYRNKMEFTFANKRWLTDEEVLSQKIYNRNAVGFHVPGMFDRIVDIEHCYLQPEPSNGIRNAIRAYAYKQKLTFYDVKVHEGFLRTLIIRTSTLGEVMVILALGHDDEKHRNAILDLLLKKYPEISSLHYVINQKKNDTLYDQDIITYKGKGFIYEKLADLTYKISPKSFFQTNPYQAVRLYETVRDFANLQGNETVYDLYTGTGSIGIFLAKHCQKVIGIEEVEAAIVDAKYNAELNKVGNTHFFAGDVKAMMDDEFTNVHGQPDVLITDPPRAGMHADVVEQILKMYPPKIVYVSCNPVTQARDLQILSEKYTIEKAQPVDMFPHTAHIENVVLLVSKAFLLLYNEDELKR